MKIQNICIQDIRALFLIIYLITLEYSTKFLVCQLQLCFFPSIIQFLSSICFVTLGVIITYCTIETQSHSREREYVQKDFPYYVVGTIFTFKPIIYLYLLTLESIIRTYGTSIMKHYYFILFIFFYFCLFLV